MSVAEKPVGCRSDNSIAEIPYSWKDGSAETGSPSRDVDDNPYLTVDVYARVLGTPKPLPPDNHGHAGKEDTMKCPKCGFVSFDYLDGCTSCGRKLSGVRQELNLSDCKPEVPFLLGSLIGDTKDDLARDQETLSLTLETELDFSGIERKET